ncbi:hypothetical protein AWJ20_2657 [Sugiyamaella lignohabitans]|uniref:Phosphatidyl synthase n=1 Tax=Sugiyamaella lignohabitans TaxID=796027 RepID=A0A161HML2_9ASCO|nr:uncharacterized protein AWJ20_2657 [Sugiyamaella lignohabitans]ANB15037.1 hypothetical protein AWJ20_2657 [Sugiyamaella lignohabitans]
MEEPQHIIDKPRIASYAFAFDIDGVLVKGSETIPEAPEALRILNGDNKYNITVPYIFVTNGGGKTEKLRCEDLSDRLGVPVLPEQFIQGHTPMKDLAEKFNTVLVVGGVGEACRNVAHSYGFRDVVTPGDILKWNPHVSPYRTLSEDEYNNSKERDFSKVAIEAILVFADSREWASDQQIILELLMSKNGVMGTTSENHDEGPPIYFAHNDFVWSTNYKLNRIGMGALLVSISALYQEHTGRQLDKVIKFGKPNQETFAYASKVLTDWRQQSYGSFSDRHTTDESDSALTTTAATTPNSANNIVLEGEESEAEEIKEYLPSASTVYFVGDTPESDIRFANTFDKRWHSILVKTGVYQDGTEPTFKPKTICSNVLEAVKFAIEREHLKELEEMGSA